MTQTRPDPPLDRRRLEERLPVSVIIAAYNRPEMTRRAVASAFAQQPVAPAEVIVVDDCSDDDTGRAAASAGAHVIRHDVNGGEGAARNTAIAAATQPWLAVLDSDDEWLPNHLATLWPLCERDDSVIVAGSALWCGPEATTVRYRGLVRGRTTALRSPAQLIYPGNFLPVSATMVRTDVTRAVGGFNPDLKFGADLDLWLRVLERGDGVMTPTPVVKYHVHPGQVTQDSDGMVSAQLRVLRSYADRPWFSAARVEAWRGSKAWDRLRSAREMGDNREALASAWFAARHPARLAGVAGVLVYRVGLRHRTRQLQSSSSPAM